MTDRRPFHYDPLKAAIRDGKLLKAAREARRAAKKAEEAKAK